jgi:predicted permease
MNRLLFTLGLILSGLLLGWLWQKRLRGQGRDGLVPFVRKRLQQLGLLVCMPISFAAAVWVVSFADPRLMLLPLLGVVVLLLGGGLGWLAALSTRQPPQRMGAMICCGSFTNIGSIGALVAFIFLGEPGFALVAIYKMFEETSYYTVGFPIARIYGAQTDDRRPGQRLLLVLKDPFFLAALIALLGGLVLNVSGLPRPAVFETINGFLVPFGTFLLLLSIGLGLRLSGIRKNLAAGLLIAGIKFLVLPLAAVGIAWILGFGDMNGGLPLKVVLVVSSMPVAFTALVAASIYDLDLDLANTCWLVTTVLLILVVPWLAFLLTLF